MTAGHPCDLSILFVRIQNLVTILEDLCVTEKTSQNDITYMDTGVCRQHYSMNKPLIFQFVTQAHSNMKQRTYVSSVPLECTQ